MMDRTWLLPLFFLLTVVTVVMGNGTAVWEQISNRSANPTTTTMMARGPKLSATGSERDRPPPLPPQKQKPAKIFSNFEKLNIWLKRFNARFQPLMNKCLHTKCQCLADLNHLAALANITRLIENSTSTKPALDLKERRKLATILLTNIIRLDGYQQLQTFRWYQCRLSAESICPSLKRIPEDYYPANRVQLLSLLMAEIVQNHTYGLSIYSYEFVQSLDELLRRLNRNLVPSAMDSNHSSMAHKWFGRENLIADLDRISDPDPLVKVESLALLIVNRLVKGENIELFESRFLRNIIQHYPPETPGATITRSTKSSSVHMDRLGFARMLKDLHIGGLIETTAEETPETDPDGWRWTQPHTHHVEVPDDGGRRAQRRIALNKALEDGECLDYTFYLDYLKQNPNLLTEQDIAQLAPIFLQQIVSKSCEHFDVGQILEESGYTQQQIMKLDGKAGSAIIYSFLAVAAVSVSSCFGFILIPFLKSRAYALMIDMLIGLAFGSMSGDALFHLIPSVLGIHSEHQEHAGQLDHGGHHHHDDQHKAQYIWQMLTVLISIYFLFLFEVISNSIAKLKSKTMKGKKPAHRHHQRKLDHKGHHHIPIRPMDSDSTTTNTSSSSFKSSQTSIGIADNPYTIQNNNNNNSSSSGDSKTHLPLSTSETRLLHNNGSVILWGMTSLAWILSISDSIHNLLDGVAIGISFSNSISRGLSTSIAVFCHEVPHEIGDFAVMLSTGMSIKRAALVNFLSACTAFIGLIIGLLLGTSDQANRWALAVCAGLFLYISLCDMLPELKEMNQAPFSFQWLLTFLFKNAGILLGYLCMILMAMFEDSLNFAA